MSRRLPALRDASIAVERDVNSKYDNVKVVANNIDEVVIASANLLIARKYIGAKATDPINRSNGDPLEDGDYYFNTAIMPNALVFYNKLSNVWATADASIAVNANSSAKSYSESANLYSSTASTASNAALAAQASAEEALRVFNENYLGSKSSDPIVDNNGATLATGAVYWDSTNNVIKYYDGSIWKNPYVDIKSLETSALASSKLSEDWAIKAIDVTSGSPSAKTSAYNSSISASQALASKDSALISKDQSKISETNAKASEIVAKDWAIKTTDVTVGSPSAKTSAVSASLSEANALIYKDSAYADSNAALAASNTAKDWATKATDVEVNKKSAKTYSELAAASTAITNTDVNTTNTNKNITNADVVTTNNNVSITNTNVLSTNNDVITANDSASISAANSNFKGEWSLLTGALSIPASVKEGSIVYMLNTNLVDVTLSNPSIDTASWFVLGTIGGVATDSSKFGSQLPAYYLNMDNSIESATAKILTSAERSNIATALQPVNKGAVNGLATLDALGKVPSTQLAIPANADNTAANETSHATVDTHMALVKEHLDWTLSLTDNIHASNYINTTYTSISFDHNSLTNYSAAEHRIINDTGTLSTELFSAAKIVNELSLKSNNHTHPYLADTTTHNSLLGVVANEHIDWTVVNAKNINAANYTDTVYVLPFIDNSANWNSAFSWGDHSLAGYSTTDTVYTLTKLDIEANLVGVITSHSHPAPPTYDDTAIKASIALNTAKVGITAQQTSDITANNAKASNVTTDLTWNPTLGSVDSSDGTNAVIPVASSTNIGILSNTDWTIFNGKQPAGSYALNGHLHTSADIGLGNVDNTSDLNKPISTATQTAIDTTAKSITRARILALAAL